MCDLCFVLFFLESLPQDRLKTSKSSESSTRRPERRENQGPGHGGNPMATSTPRLLLWQQRANSEDGGRGGGGSGPSRRAVTFRELGHTEDGSTTGKTADSAHEEIERGSRERNDSPGVSQTLSGSSDDRTHDQQGQGVDSGCDRACRPDFVQSSYTMNKASCWVPGGSGRVQVCLW